MVKLKPKWRVYIRKPVGFGQIPTVEYVGEVAGDDALTALERGKSMIKCIFKSGTFIGGIEVRRSTVERLEDLVLAAEERRGGRGSNWNDFRRKPGRPKSGNTSEALGLEGSETGDRTQAAEGGASECDSEAYSPLDLG